ncbi:hypothetical protein Q5752_000200 [Cryptotrichosporon argae]
MSSAAPASDLSKPARAEIIIERVTEATLAEYAPRLGALISAHIDQNNQSINFVGAYTAAQAAAKFSDVAPALSRTGPGRDVMWVARLAPGSAEAALPSVDHDGNETAHADIVGTVRLSVHWALNGQFRADVCRLMVDLRYGGRGIARKLMDVLEDEARKQGITLLLLDTEQGYHAEQLYYKLGYKLAGYVPNYAMTPDGKEKRGGAFMYKELA